MILVGLIDKGDHAAVRAQIGGLPREDEEED
jgi:hypothetical protein